MPPCVKPDVVTPKLVNPEGIHPADPRGPWPPTRTVVVEDKRIAGVPASDTVLMPRELLREARDNCEASIAEDGISAHRKKYRVELHKRLSAALANGVPVAQAPSDDDIAAFEAQLRREYGHAAEMMLERDFSGDYTAMLTPIRLHYWLAGAAHARGVALSDGGEPR